MKLGCVINNKNLVHKSIKNAAAGYDIYSNYNEERFIEIKTSTKKENDFFITENELAILKAKESNAYIYRVLITDLLKKEGKVFDEIKNPFVWIETKMKKIPKLYQISEQ